MTERPLVLVADDDADILELVSFRIELFGYDVLQARSGDEALTLAFERQPALVVLDVMMPGLTGYEVAVRLRADERTTSLPILLLTASVRDEHEAKARDVGADAYMRKPFEPAELERCVRALVDRGKEAVKA